MKRSSPARRRSSRGQDKRRRVQRRQEPSAVTATLRGDPSALLTLNQLLEILACSRTTLWRLREAPDFPRPILLSATAVRYRRRDVDTWISKRSQSPTGAAA
jgi:predicted DNA-binding transcriptional regulator AlpA